MEFIDKLEIAEHWDYITQNGREWYLKRTRQNLNNSVIGWKEMPFSTRSKIGRLMNDRRADNTKGRYTKGFVTNDVEIGLARYGPMIQGILRNLNPEERESIADLNRYVTQKLQEIYPMNDYLGFNERIARKTVDKLIGKNIKKAEDGNKSLGTFGTILAGVLIGLGGYATIKTIKGVMSKSGYDPTFLNTAIGSVVGSGLLIGGTKKIINLRKGITFITVKSKDEYMSQVPRYASDEGFHGGHEVITTDGEQGVIQSLQGQYVEIRQKSGKLSRVHVDNLIKADEVIISKDGATKWGLLSFDDRRELLKAKNLPQSLSDKHWSQLHKNVHQIILKTDNEDDGEDAELSLEEKGDKVKTKPEIPENITETAEKGQHSSDCGCKGCKKKHELIKAVLDSKKKLTLIKSYDHQGLFPSLIDILKRGFDGGGGKRAADRRWSIGRKENPERRVLQTGSKTGNYVPQKKKMRVVGSNVWSDRNRFMKPKDGLKYPTREGIIYTSGMKEPCRSCGGRLGKPYDAKVSGQNWMKTSCSNQACKRTYAIYNKPGHPYRPADFNRDEYSKEILTRNVEGELMIQPNKNRLCSGCSTTTPEGKVIGKPVSTVNPYYAGRGYCTTCGDLRSGRGRSRGMTPDEKEKEAQSRRYGKGGGIFDPTAETRKGLMLLEQLVKNTK